MSDLASFTTRVLASLNDPSAGRYLQAMTDEGLRRALIQYSRAAPQMDNQVLTVAAAGRDMAIPNVTRLQSIYRVIYPYDSTQDYQPILNHAGRIIERQEIREDYYYYWKAGAPYLHISGYDVPQVGEQILVYYAMGHSINNLDGATATTILLEHEPMLIVGAAAEAATMLASTQGTFPNMSQLKLWADTQQADFTLWLKSLASQTARQAGPQVSAYWRLDRWDGSGWRSRE
ncbi:MAG: hypothetical protein P4L50_15905 [Anaerolineaceae bacterium]|nr:hypothetical protein [Anaerolineaceae bacterium]